MEPLAQQTETMGFLGIMDPLTELGLVNRMKAMGVPDATLSNVKMLWEAYTDAVVTKKLPPFFKDVKWAPTFDDMLKTTELPKQVVSAFLTALRAQAIESGSNQFLDPANGTKLQQQAIDIVKTILQVPGKILQTASKPIVDTAGDASSAIIAPLKWTAIGLAAVAAIYLVFNAAPFLKAAKKKGK